jgi:NAD(P)-dependent dehydrogenase (short-subunit alcohol dehydrogenase family)
MAKRKVLVITGASDGIGAAAARKAADFGHEVVVIGRNPEKTRAVAESLGARHYTADFTNLDAVAELADRLLADLDRIDVLANNAGGVVAQRRVTADGFEQTLQMNHLAPFVLTHRLLPLLRESRARVVQTSSQAATRGTVRFEDLQGESTYREMRAYAQTKLANVLFTSELHRRYGDSLTATSFHPGVIGSSFGRDGSLVVKWFFSSGLARRVLTPPEVGAERLLWLALSPEDAGWVPGAFHVENRPVVLPAEKAGPEVAARLWEETSALVKGWL